MELVLVHLLVYKGESYQIIFLFITVADGTMDQIGMKTALTIFLPSIMTEMTVIELQATDHTLKVCEASQN